MEKKLIFKDVKAAAVKVAKIKELHPKVNDIYRLIIALDETISPDVGRLIDVIVDRMHYKEMGNDLTNLVQEAIISKAGEPEFNGVKIDREKLKALLSFPSCTHIYSKIKESFGQEQISHLQALADHLMISDGVLGLKDGFEDVIEASFEYYTQTDKGNQLMTHLEATRTALNNYNNYITKSQNRDNRIFDGDDNIKGLKFYNGEFIFDLSYVLNFERS